MRFLGQLLAVILAGLALGLSAPRPRAQGGILVQAADSVSGNPVIISTNGANALNVLGR